MAEIFEVLREPEKLLQPRVQSGINPFDLLRLETDPDTFSRVITQVTIDKGELVAAKDHYATLWNMFFVNRQWYYHNNNGLKLARLFPAFAVAEFTRMPFNSPSEEQKDKHEYLQNLFNTCYLVLPFKRVRREPTDYSSPGVKIDFIGASFNQYETFRSQYQLTNTGVILHAVCAYGYFQQMQISSNNRAFKLRLGDITVGTSQGIQHLGRTQDRATVDTASDKVLEVFRACEYALLGERMEAA